MGGLVRQFDRCLTDVKPTFFDRLLTYIFFDRSSTYLDRFLTYLI
jgi:hypothetical protein